MSLSKQYDAFYQSSQQKQSLNDVQVNRWPRNRVEAIVHCAGEGGTVLDIGCGDGYLLFQLRKRYGRLVGLEYSPHRLEQAKLNLSGLAFEGLVGSAEAIDALDSDSIDCMVSADTIEHIPDVYAAAAEMFRVLKPGGKLVINTPNIAFIKKRLLLLLGRFPSTSQPNEGLGSDIMFDGGHLHYFTFRSLRMVLERAGFSMEQAVGYGSFGKVHDLYPPLLSGGVQWVARKPG